MKARILFVTDLHKRATESMSIKGQREVQKLIQEDIINFCTRNNCTHIVIMGDWYHRGYHSIGPAWSDMEMDKKISRCVNGNVYLVVGNHFYMERDENPEMYIIQPCPNIRPQQAYEMPDEPIFRVVPNLKIGTVQISFFHFSKLQKDYTTLLDKDVTFHIGCYHDDICVPGYIAELEGYSSRSTSMYLNNIYANVDVAIHGHIHVKHDIVPLELASGKRVPLFIPGSLGITANTEKMKHPSVSLPVITIDDDDKVQVQVAAFKTHIDMLRFYQTQSKAKKTMSEEPLSEEVKTQLLRPSGVRSLASYVGQKGYNNKQLKLLGSAAQGPVMLASAVNILTAVEEVEEIGNADSIC